MYVKLSRNIILSGLFLLVLPIFHCTGSGSGEKENIATSIIEIRGHTMGTTFLVKIVSQKKQFSENDKNSLENSINKRLKRVNQSMSTYIKDSEISRFNTLRTEQWFPVSVDTARVFAESLRISTASEGAFDITLGPLIKLWGFGTSKRTGDVPSDDQLSHMKSKVGFSHLSVQTEPPSLRKTIPELYCDLSGIAKGFGVDVISRLIEALGFENYMVEIGGEVRARGYKPGNMPWRVAIATPDGTSSFQKVISLSNMSMATSGDYHNYFEKEGVRYSHTIDPITGKPITHKLASVTVMHPSCMTADGMATAINVMGSEKGYQLAIKEKLAIFMIIRENGAFVEKMTPSFERYTTQDGHIR